MRLANRNRADDQPPARVRDESIETGQRLDPNRWNKLLDQYYEEHEWDRETGRPSLRTLKKLDLQRFTWVIEAAGAVEGVNAGAVSDRKEGSIRDER